LQLIHPRPQLQRHEDSWTDLAGIWQFSFDDSEQGLREGWFKHCKAADLAFQNEILVPFPPESTASGIGVGGYHPTVWYRTVLPDSPVRMGTGRRLLHFGAVDFHADVWLAGQYLGSHKGGSTPFQFDITQLSRSHPTELNLVVRANDEPGDVTQPRGKQDWRESPHGIWYERTTGIWQPVWVEDVPDLFVDQVHWTPDLTRGCVHLSIELNQKPATDVVVDLKLRLGETLIEQVSFTGSSQRMHCTVTLAGYRNGQDQEAMLWSPENPHLIDVTLTIENGTAEDDVINSYFGMRSAAAAGGHFLLNDRPYYIRAILGQGFWPDSHLAAPSDDALRAEVQLIKDLGFNAVRVHQKVEDPRFLYWADTLGLLVWGESASAYEFSPVAVERMATEWLAVLRRDHSHPCIVTWVPLNESWGIQQVAHDPAQLHYAQALYHLTKAVDPSRPVVSNDGWEHADSDIWTIHDYSSTGGELAANYVDMTSARELMNGIGPLGRRMRLLETPDRGQPLIVSEFGGIAFANPGSGEAWGYSKAETSEELEYRLRELFEAIQMSPALAGFCYTQFSDTRQEVNGLVDAHRVPKLPVDTIRSIVLGARVDTSSQRRPRLPVEDPVRAEPRDQ